MVTRFDMHNPKQVIGLAILLQTDVYWDEYYYLEENDEVNRINAKDLLQIIDDKMDYLDYIQFHDGDVKFVYNHNKGDEHE